MKRRKTRLVKAGGISIGGGNPVSVQAMCTTDTRDWAATSRQINSLERAGCEIARVAIPDGEAALAVGKIKKRIKIPLVADVHFDWRLALEALRQGADKIRINPGNIGSAAGVREIALACAAKGVPVRVGVNAGSLKSLKNRGVRWSANEWASRMADEALEQTAELEKYGLKDLVVSLKADDTERTILANRIFSGQSDIPLHLGVTEAGSFISGAVKSAIALGTLLSEGIGDTIRVSLTEEPEVQVRCAFEILKALGLREFGPEIISCPTCGRCRAPVRNVVSELEKKIYSSPELMRLSRGLKIAVMGCAVNGPGEARQADFGIAGGKGEGVWFEKGKITKKLPQSRWVSAIISRIRL